MTIKRSQLCLCLIAAGGSFFARMPAAHAEGGAYEECAQILQQDIMNRSNSSAASRTASATAQANAFFSMSDSQAYQQYSKDYEQARSNHTNIDVEGHYLFAGGDFATAISSERKLSEHEFNELRTRERAQFKSSAQSRTEFSQNLATAVATQSRDAESVRAWRDCVLKSRDTGVYAYSNRDKAGKVYVNVMWVPGPLAASVPAIPISFVTGSDQSGLKVIAEPKEVVAMGSGRSFAVECGKDCDEGFTVSINATAVSDSGKVLGSYTNSVEVPALAPSEAKMRDQYATRGAALANQDPLAIALRNQQPDEAARRGFDIGMGIAEGHTLPGPGKARFGAAMPVDQQTGYDAAVQFSVDRNRNRDLATRGALVAQRDAFVALSRTNQSVFYTLGFDVGAGLFAEQASGGLGHTLEGPGSRAIRDGLNVEGQMGFRAAVDLFLVQKHKAL